MTPRLAALLRIEFAHVPKLGPEFLVRLLQASDLRILAGGLGSGLRLNVFTQLGKLGLASAAAARSSREHQGLTLDVSQTFKAGRGKSQ